MGREQPWQTCACGVGLRWCTAAMDVMMGGMGKEFEEKKAGKAGRGGCQENQQVKP